MSRDHALRLGVVGCGDVAVRQYLPTLSTLAGTVDLVACCDAAAGRARAAAAACRDWAPAVRHARDVSAIARSERLDGVMNLTPPAAHAEVTASCVEAGLHVFSEKPLAMDLSAGRALVAQAERSDTMLLCAPAVMATARFRWLSDLVGSGRLGRITLVTGQLANLGPAAWRPYTGDVAAYYGAGVGPLADQGVYLLHAMVGLLGPVRRLQAFAARSMPYRTSTAIATLGLRIPVEAPDHWLVQLDFGHEALGQLLSSYAVPASRAPLLELHGEQGSISISESPPLTDAGPVDLYLREEDPDFEGWLAGVSPPTPPRAANSMIGVGLVHFVECLAGREQPILTADHALHVLEIVHRCRESAERGEALALETSFPWPREGSGGEPPHGS